jgi:hypothetical protein
MDYMELIDAFEQEEREFLFEMVEPTLDDSYKTLREHNGEELSDVEDVEAWSNIMGRQKRRIAFMEELKMWLERSLGD